MLSLRGLWKVSSRMLTWRDFMFCFYFYINYVYLRWPFFLLCQEKRTLLNIRSNFLVLLVCKASFEKYFRFSYNSPSAHKQTLSSSLQITTSMVIIMRNSLRTRSRMLSLFSKICDILKNRNWKRMEDENWFNLVHVFFLPFPFCCIFEPLKLLSCHAETCTP